MVLTNRNKGNEPAHQVACNLSLCCTGLSIKKEWLSDYLEIARTMPGQLALFS